MLSSDFCPVVCWALTLRPVDGIKHFGTKAWLTLPLLLPWSSWAGTANSSASPLSWAEAGRKPQLPPRRVATGTITGLEPSGHPPGGTTCSSLALG